MTEGTAPASTADGVASDSGQPRRQEQEGASSEVVEVAPGILRMQLPIDFTGLGHVNTYALEDRRGVAIVDPGLPGKKSWESLEDRLSRAGIPLGRVHTVIITHSHPDHFGGAGLLAEMTGAAIVASHQFRTWWDPDEDWNERELEPADPSRTHLPGGTTSAEPLAHAIVGRTHTPDGKKVPPSPFGRPTPWGGKTEELPPERRAELERNLEEALRWFRVPCPSIRLRDNDPITLAEREWFGLYTPGHTNDHLCLFDPTEGVLLAGDHVLPTITPHISGMIEGDPLARYVESLDRIASFSGVKTVLPAHGQPFGDLPRRVEEIKRHHELRLARLAEISDSLGWATVQELSQQLFAPRAWGSMAESETYAHLEHERLRGRAERREVEGRLEYRITG
ncbi:MAG: MBL fold metallo-hydrolase [Acidimicrobiales bacterium]|nr:MBL fold metallo-hydrolase [Acidimicrobiales bacterium]